jgi:hypothetical protein
MSVDVGGQMVAEGGANWDLVACGAAGGRGGDSMAINERDVEIYI